MSKNLRFIALNAFVLSACSVKMQPIEPLEITAASVGDTAWLGVDDTRDRPAEVVQATTSFVPIANGQGGTTLVPVTSVANVPTGELSGDAIAETLTTSLVDAVIAENMVGYAGDDITSLSGLQRVSEAYPEHRCLVLFELEHAKEDRAKLNTKTMGVSILSGLTLGLAYPLLLPYIYSPAPITYEVSGLVKIFDRETDRFEGVYPIEIAGSVEVSGVVWFPRSEGAQQVSSAATVAASLDLAHGISEVIRCGEW